MKEVGVLIGAVADWTRVAPRSDERTVGKGQASTMPGEKAVGDKEAMSVPGSWSSYPSSVSRMRLLDGEKASLCFQRLEGRVVGTLAAGAAAKLERRKRRLADLVASATFEVPSS